MPHSPGSISLTGGDWEFACSPSGGGWIISQMELLQPTLIDSDRGALHPELHGIEHQEGRECLCF